MQVVLVMFRSDGERRSFSITRDMTVIGRREDSDLRIPLGDVSRKHCRIIKDGDALRVEDLGSSNGTFCNGERVTQCDLSPGDTLQVGPVVFVTQVDGFPADDELQPVIAAPAAAAGAEGAEGEAEVELEPLADAEPGEFDPMEALNADPEGSAFDFNIEDELASGAAEAGDAAAPEAENLDGDGVNVDEIEQMVDLDDSTANQARREHDQNV